MFKTCKAIVIVLMISMILSLAVSAEGEVINVDGNWHEPAQVSVWATTDQTSGLAGSMEWDIQRDNPVILPYKVNINDPATVWIGVPLRGEDWQVNANGKVEIRFNLSVLTSLIDGIDYTNKVSLFSPGTLSTGAPYWWGSNKVFCPNEQSVKMQSYTTAPEGKKVDVYRAFYGGNTSTDAAGNAFYAYGYMFDVIIPDGMLDSETRTIYFPVQTSTADGMMVSMTYCQVRSLDNLSNYEILASILAAVQDIQGISPEQMKQAVYDALQMFAEEEQNKIDDKAGEAQTGIDTIISKVKETINIDAIEAAYEPYINLITSTETADFDLTTQPLYITLSGEEIQILPSIPFNVTEAVRSLDGQAVSSSRANGIGGGWEALKTLIGAIITVSSIWMCIIVTKQLIEQVVSGEAKSDMPDDITGG